MTRAQEDDCSRLCDHRLKIFSYDARRCSNSGEGALSTSDEILNALQQAGAGAGQALAAANAAKAKSEQAIQQSAALGARDKIAEFTALKAAIEELLANMAGTQDKAGQVIARARAAAG